MSWFWIFWLNTEWFFYRIRALMTVSCWSAVKQQFIHYILTMATAISWYSALMNHFCRMVYCRVHSTHMDMCLVYPWVALGLGRKAIQNYYAVKNVLIKHYNLQTRNCCLQICQLHCHTLSLQTSQSIHIFPPTEIIGTTSFVYSVYTHCFCLPLLWSSYLEFSFRQPSFFLKHLFNSVHILKHISSAKLAPGWPPAPPIHTNLWFCAPH